MTGLPGDAVVAVDIARCALPLDRAVHVGQTVYREREYVALRLTTAAGIEGHAIGYTRGLPLDAMARMLPTGILGRAVADRAEVMTGLVAANINAAASLWRAFSLVDIALADAAARLAGLPLWRLLGAARSRVPVMAVAGYHAAERGVEEVLAEVAALVDAGVRHVKLHTDDVALVSRIKASLDDDVRLGVDAGMAWGSVAEALEPCLRLDELGLGFIEDPFMPDRWRLTAELADRLRTPLAAGEDAAGPAALEELARVVGVLRVDPSVSGGYTGVLQAATLAQARGAPVMTHALPDQHAHLAGSEAIGMVELIPDAAGVNPVGRLLARRQVVESGELVLSDEPGHGAPLDWQAVERSSREVTRHRA